MSDKPKVPKRMTVAKLGERMEELTEVVDIMHVELGEIKELLKTLIELQIVQTPAIADNEDWVDRMYS